MYNIYKVVYNNKIIDVIKYPIYLRFLNFGHVTTTGRTSAQGIVASDGDTIYALSEEAAKIRPDAKLVKIIKITAEEFDVLKAKLDQKEIVNEDDSELAKAKRIKIASLSRQCNSQIVSGFTVVLADGEEKHFKLTTEDQLNLMVIEAQLLNTQSECFIYHATDLPCVVMSRTDMARIVKAARAHQLYHTTYFNFAKQYVNSLTDLRAVHEFTYGTDVSSIADDNILKQILRNGGASQ
jgi:hypothetical protein